MTHDNDDIQSSELKILRIIAPLKGDEKDSVFEDVPTKIFSLANKLRVEVFCDEQKVPEENEIDEVDFYRGYPGKGSVYDSLEFMGTDHWLLISKKNITLEPSTFVLDKVIKADNIIDIDDGSLFGNDDISDICKNWQCLATLRIFPPYLRKESGKSGQWVLSNPEDKDMFREPNSTGQTQDFNLKLGRMAVCKNLRGMGMGSVLLTAAEEYYTKKTQKFLQSFYKNRVAGSLSFWLHAQIDKRKFYAKNGYLPVQADESLKRFDATADQNSEDNMKIFWEEGIAHIHMRKMYRWL